MAKDKRPALWVESCSDRAERASRNKGNQQRILYRKMLGKVVACLKFVGGAWGYEAFMADGRAELAWKLDRPPSGPDNRSTSYLHLLCSVLNS